MTHFVAGSHQQAATHLAIIYRGFLLILMSYTHEAVLPNCSGCMLLAMER